MIVIKIFIFSPFSFFSFLLILFPQCFPFYLSLQRSMHRLLCRIYTINSLPRFSSQLTFISYLAIFPARPGGSSSSSFLCVCCWDVDFFIHIGWCWSAVRAVWGENITRPPPLATNGRLTCCSVTGDVAAAISARRLASKINTLYMAWGEKYDIRRAPSPTMLFVLLCHEGNEKEIGTGHIEPKRFAEKQRICWDKKNSRAILREYKGKY